MARRLLASARDVCYGRQSTKFGASGKRKTPERVLVQESVRVDAIGASFGKLVGLTKR